MGDFVVLQENKAIPAGFQILAPGASIAIRPTWLDEVLATKRREKMKKALMSKNGDKMVDSDSSAEIQKRLMDGFFDPDDLAVYGGTEVFEGHKIFESLKCYAVHCLRMSAAEFHYNWNQKMCSARRTLKRHVTFKNKKC